MYQFPKTPKVKSLFWTTIKHLPSALIAHSVVSTTERIIESRFCHKVDDKTGPKHKK